MGRPRKVVQEDIVAKTVETPVEKEKKEKEDKPVTKSVEIKQVELTDEDEIDIVNIRL